jgi:predicted helicase
VAWSPGKDGRVPNLNLEFVNNLENLLNLKFVSDGIGDLTSNFGPEDIFHYIYAVLHSPTYRQRYAEFLKGDFPRVPLTSNIELFRRLCALGKELADLHLLESSNLEVSKFLTHYPVTGDNFVEKGFPKYITYENDGPGYVFINKTQYLEGVPKDVWEFHVGGYKVCEKWLKDRRGRQLSYDDLTRYQKVILALKETIRLMEEIDKNIPEWPIK